MRGNKHENPGNPHTLARDQPQCNIAMTDPAGDVAFTVTHHDGYENLPPAYATFFDAAAPNHGLFATLPWLVNLARMTASTGSAASTAATIPDSTALAFQPPCAAAGTTLSDDAVDRTRLYAVASAGAPDLPLLVLPTAFDARRAFFLAPRRLRCHANFYSSLAGPIAAGGIDPGPPTRALMAAIAAERPRWDILQLAPLDTGSPLYETTIAALARQRLRVRTYFCFVNWTLDVCGRPFADYYASLPSRLRSTVDRKSRQLENSAGFRLAILTRPDEAAAAIEAFETVYAASWKEPEPYPGFMPGLIRTCAREGWLRMGVIWLDRRPIAAQLWIVAHGVASIYKLAYDEAEKKRSAGSVLTARLMRHAIDVDKVVQVDYLTGDDAYKRDWMSTRRERRGIIAYNLRSARGLGAAFADIGAGRLKRLLRGRTS